jgi:fused signal recognition particle receptor
VEKDNIIMGLFSKLKDLITRKKSISSKIKEKNSDAQLVEEKKFDAGLRKSSSSLNDIVNSIAKKYIKVDEELIDNLKEYFIKFDIGIQATNKIVDAIIDEIKYQNTSDIKLIKSIIVDKLFVYYIQNTQVDTSLNLSSNKNNVILVSGVNGAGKTTSIAKLINFFQKQNKKVLVAAADTFRAGAVEQLEI